MKPTRTKKAQTVARHLAKSAKRLLHRGERREGKRLIESELTTDETEDGGQGLPALPVT